MANDGSSLGIKGQGQRSRSNFKS